MEKIRIKTPIGIRPFRDEIERICGNSSTYKCFGIKPPHFIINLDAGNGQSKCTQYCADSFKSYEIRHFGGLDTYLEYTLDGTMSQLKNIFCDIRSCAVYTNNYEGIIAIDISILAFYINEAQVDFFISEVKNASISATFIFYVPMLSDKNISRLIDKLNDNIDNIRIITVAPYTLDELAYISEESIKGYGICINDSTEEFHNTILHIIAESGINTAKESAALADKIIHSANSSDFNLSNNTQKLFKAFFDKDDCAKGRDAR